MAYAFPVLVFVHILATYIGASGTRLTGKSKNNLTLRMRGKGVKSSRSSGLPLASFGLNLAALSTARARTDEPAFTTSDILTSSVGNSVVLPTKCGFSIDCPRDYTIADVKAAQVASEEDVAQLRKKHDEARLACASDGDEGNNVLEDGGWCYDKSTSKLIKADDNNYDVDFYLPLHHCEADETTVSLLSEKILLKDDGSCCHSLSDLGAGVGQLGHALQARLPELEFHGYDGAGNIEEFTNNYVRFADLTLPLSAKRTAWVISSEVGEHIPHKYEAQVIANLHAHNCRGIVLTWAVLGQYGHGHVNNHSNEYLINLFEELGYKKNDELSNALRAYRPQEKNYWLMNSAMVFDRLDQPAECEDL